MSDHKRRHDKSGSSKTEKVYSSSSKYQDYEEKYSKQRRSQSYDGYYEAAPKQTTSSKSTKKRAHSPKATQFYKEKSSFKDKGSYSGQSCSKAYYRSRSSSHTPPRNNKRCRSSYSMSPPPPPQSRTKPPPSYNDYGPSRGAPDWDPSDSKACMSMRPSGGMNGVGYGGDYYNEPPPAYSGYEGDGGYGYMEDDRGPSNYGNKGGMARGAGRGYHGDPYSSGYRDSGYPPVDEYEPAPSYNKPKYDHYNDYSEPKGGTTQLSRYVIGDSVVYGPPGHYPQGLLSRSPSPVPRRDRYERYSRPGRGSPSPPPRQPAMAGDYHPHHPSGGSNYPLRRVSPPTASGYDGRREDEYDGRRRSMSPAPPSGGRHPPPSSAYDKKYGEAMAGSNKSRRPPSPPSYPSRGVATSRPSNSSERHKTSGNDARDRVDHPGRRKDRLLPPPSPPSRAKRGSDAASPRRGDRGPVSTRQEGMTGKSSSGRHANGSRSRSPVRPLARDDRSREGGSRNEHRPNARTSKGGGRDSRSSREDGKGAESRDERRTSMESRRKRDEHSGQKSRDNSRTSSSKEGKADSASEASSSKAGGDSSSAGKKKPLLSTPPRTHMLPMKPPLLSTPPVLPLPTPNPPPLMGVRPMLGGVFPPLLGRPPGPPLFDAPPAGGFQRPFDGLRTGRQSNRGRDGRPPLRRPMDLRGLIEQRKQPMQQDGNRQSHVGGRGHNMRQDGRPLNNSLRSNNRDNIRDNRLASRGSVTSRTYDSRGTGGGRQQLSNRLQPPNSGRLQGNTHRSLSSNRNQSSAGSRLLSGSNARNQGVRNRTQTGARLPTNRNLASRAGRSPVRSGGGGGTANNSRSQQTTRAPARPVQANVTARRTNILRKYQRLTDRRRVVGGRGATKTTSGSTARPPIAARKRPSSSSSRPQQRSRADDSSTRRDSNSSNRKQPEKTKSSQSHSPRKSHKNRKSSPAASSRYSRSPLKSSKKRPASLSRSPSSSGSSSPDSRGRRRTSSSPHYSKSPRHSKFARSSPGYVPSNSRGTKRSSPAPSKYSKPATKSFKRSRISRSLTRSPTTSPSVSPDNKSGSLSLTP